MERTVLILGATSDIARALAKLHAQAGHRLYLAGRKEIELNAEAEDLKIRYEAEVKTVLFDAEKNAEHPAIYQALDPKPDLVYCVFGYLGDQAIAEQKPEEARKILQVNYLGAVSILEESAREMSTSGRGTIVGIGSVAGDRGRASNYFYGSAKAGFAAYLSGLRNRLYKKGVHVLTVKPGFVRTRMTEGMDLPPVITAEPDQVARAIWRAVQKKKNRMYTRWMWRYIMWIIRNIPEPIFKKMNL